MEGVVDNDENTGVITDEDDENTGVITDEDDENTGVITDEDDAVVVIAFCAADGIPGITVNIYDFHHKCV
jgi:hypothetical protein